jgi:hypothetical protein
MAVRPEKSLAGDGKTLEVNLMTDPVPDPRII